MRTRRRGFVLIAVLWVMVGVSALGFGTALIARRAVDEARNRIALRAASWSAQDCVSRAQAVIGAALEQRTTNASDSTSWGTLSGSLAASPLMHGSECSVELHAAGQRLNVNVADSA